MTGGRGGGGGGGAGLGGAVAIFPGATVTISNCTLGTGGANSAAGGAGGTSPAGGTSNGGNGATLGQDIFLAGDTVNTFHVTSAMTIPSALESDTNPVGARLIKTGAGTLTLNGTSSNLYQGTTSIDEGIISIAATNSIGPNTIIFNGGSLQTTAAPITLASPLNLLASVGTINTTVSGDLFATGVISGAGNLTKIGMGTLSPTNSNTYTGATNFNDGFISITNPNQLGSGDLNFSGGILTTNLAAPGTLPQNINLLTTGRFNITGANGLTLTGSITGTGNLIKDSVGSLILQNNGGNTYSGTTTIIDGEIQAGLPNSFSPNSAVNLIIAAILDLNNFNQTIASLTSASGASQVQLGSGNLTTGDSSNTLFAGVISGTGSLIKQGSGTFTLANNNSYSGGTQFNGGVLAVNAAARLGSAGSPLVFNGGTLQTTGTFSLAKNVTMTGSGTFDTVSGILTLLNPVTGAGTLNKIGTGTLVFSGANSNSGLTDIIAGTVQAGIDNGLSSFGSFNVGAAGILDLSPTTMQSIGSLSGDVGASVLLGAALLTTGSGNTNTSFSGDISGTGSLVKTGTGIFTLGNGSSYTGATQVQQGTLNIANGSLQGPITVALGAKLSGNFSLIGSMANLINFGNVSPGNSIGTINVLGDYTQDGNSILSIEIDPAGNTSLLNVTGMASIAGSVIFTPQPGVYLPETFYTFLTAGMVVGTFDQFSFTGPTRLASRLIYDPGMTFVQLQLFFGPQQMFDSGSFQPPAANVASYLNCAVESRNSDLVFVFNEIQNLDHSAQQQALASISPAILGSLSLAEESNAVAVRTAVSHRTNLLHSIDCPIEDKQKVGVSLWLDGFEQWVDQDDWKDETGFHTKNRGLVLGIDYQVMQNLFVGAAGSYAHSHVSWDDGGGHANIGSYYGGLYVTWYRDLFYLDASIFGSRNTYHTTRYLDFDVIHRRAKGDHNGYEAAANLSAGLTFFRCNSKSEKKEACSSSIMLLVPFFSLDYLYLHEESFNEKGAQSLDLHVRQKDSNLLRSEVGLRSSGCVTFSGLRLVPEIKLSYVRESRFNDKNYRSYLNEVGQSLCGSFSTNTNPPSRNLFNPEIGLNILVLKDALDISAFYEANIGNNYTQQEGRLHFEYRF